MTQTTQDLYIEIDVCEESGIQASPSRVMTDKETVAYMKANDIFAKNKPIHPEIIAGILRGELLPIEVDVESERVPPSNKSSIAAVALRPAVSLRHSTEFMSSPRPAPKKARALPPPSRPTVRTKSKLVLADIKWTPSIPPPPGQHMKTLPDLVPVQ